MLFHLFSNFVQHISIIFHRSRYIFLDIISRFCSIFVHIITLLVDEVFLTILGHLVVNDPFDGVKGNPFVLWYVLLMIRVIVVVFEHVRSKNWMTRVASGDVEPAIAMFFVGSNLVWAAPNSLQILSQVFLKGSSLVHDEVFHLKCNVCIAALLCILE